MNILVTSGATREKIDSVRYLSNFSTGSTGAFLADSLSEGGHWLRYLHGIGAVQSRLSRQSQQFTSFDDLDQQLRRILSGEEIDVVVHAAAVSDFSVDSVIVDSREHSPEKLLKIDSNSTVMIKLKRNHKILLRLKEYAANRELVVIGFKLTHSEDATERLAKVMELTRHDSVDYVVHNDLSEISDRQHRFAIYRRDRRIHEGHSKVELARRLLTILSGPSPR